MAETHKATWWVYAGTGRIRHTATMRGTWGYDVTCSCGWDSRTGGATRRYCREKLNDHRAAAAADAPVEWAGRTFGELTVDERRRAARAAGAQLAAELTANAAAISAVLDEEVPYG